MMDNLSTIPINEMNPVSRTKSSELRKIYQMLKHKHLLETTERIKWEGLPPELNQDLIERILYFRFKGALFKFNEKYWFLPFTLKGTIDSYGRYETITPVLFTGQFGTTNKKGKDTSFLDEKVIGKTFLACYQEGLELKSGQIPAIILNDTTLEVSQDYTPMNSLIDPLIQQLVDILVLVNIDLVTSAKVFYIVAKDQNQKEAIEDEFNDLDSRIMNGKRVVVVTSELQLQELTGGNQAKDQARYFQTYQSFDNLRKDIIGISNSGQFMKQEHTTELETEKNASGGSSVLNNALRQRREFCDLVNHYYGLSISVSDNQPEDEEIVQQEGEQTKQLRGDE